MATARVPQVPKSNTNLSVPVPFPLKGAPIPLLLLTLPSQLGAAVPFSAQPFVVQRRRAFHRSLTARAVSLDWPVRPWMRGLFSSRRRLQSKVQLHRWSLARRDVEWPRRVHANAAPPSSSPSGQPPGMQPPNGAQPPPVATTPDVSMSMDAPVVPPSSSVTDSTSETHSDWLLTGRHFLTFIMVLVLGVVASALYLYTARDVEFSYALYKSSLDLLRTTGFRQTLALVGAIIFVRFGLEPIVRLARHIFGVRGPWAQSSEYYLLKEVYRPIEGLLVVAAFATLVENFAPSLIAIPKATVSHVVHSILSIAFVMATAGVIFNVKARMVKETAWQLELSGKLTQQRRVEAIDKLLTLLTLLVSSILGLQAVGLDINSLLAIGGIGGLAAGLAGRELLENLFNGMIIMSSNPFEVGEEVIFHHNGREVEGIVLDVGWYRTTIRSFAREVFVIPNSVFSRTVVLNVTRKNGEWRFYEFLHLRPEDVDKARDIVADMRKVIRTHPSVIQKLHRRAFLDSLTKEECGIYLSFYCAATNRDAFMAIRQDLFMMFLDIIKQHGAQLAKKSLRVYLQDDGRQGGGQREVGFGERPRMESNIVPVQQQHQDVAGSRHAPQEYHVPVARPDGANRAQLPPAVAIPRQSMGAAVQQGQGQQGRGQRVRYEAEQRAPVSGPELAESIIYGAVVMGSADPNKKGAEGGRVDMIVGEWTDQGSWTDDRA